MKKRICICGTLSAGLVAVVFLLPTLNTCVAAQERLNQVSDGSLTPPVHLIPLLAQDPVDENKTVEVSPEDEMLLPFSARWTCSVCHIQDHNYVSISSGWHFNAANPDLDEDKHGRVGQPWIFVDAGIATQIPLSYRPWPGTFRPDAVGISPFRFTQLFGRHMPGGGVGELDSEVDDEIPRQFISGKLEINCLVCHNADPAQDMAEYAGQVERQNLIWAAAGASGIASVSGSTIKMPETYDYTMPEMIDDPELIPHIPAIKYDKSAFDEKNQVFFDIVREVPNERCYYCHSNVNVDMHGSEKWTADEDIHLTAGMTCVDCHRNGLDHNIVRGYEGEDTTNPLAAVTSCKGCHLGENGENPAGGRLGAPVPEHPGIPPVHFERLSCTACHSGPWPSQQAYRAKTSRAHALGTHNVNKHAEALPHIMTPVFAKQADGRIAPHKLIWPAYWGTLNGEDVEPVAIDVVKKTVGKVLAEVKLPVTGDWPELTEQHVVDGLKALQESGQDRAVYVGGGRVYELDDAGELTEKTDHPAAEPYCWPLAHNVRPAAQSLGVRRCEDCHSVEEGFFFGKVAVDSPVAAVRGQLKTMVEFEQVGPLYTKLFAMSFVFRPWLKVVALASCGLIGIVLLLYGLGALACVAKVLVGKE